MSPRAVDSSAPAEWQGLFQFGVNELTAASLRRLKRLTPPISVFRATGLGLTLPILWRGNPDQAAEIYRGRFVFDGAGTDAGSRSIFEHPGAGPAWSETLHGFSWLSHLQAAGSELSRVQARALIADWIDARRRLPRTAFRTAVLGRRIISWVRHASFLLKGAPQEFRDMILGGLTAETRSLTRRLSGEVNGAARLTGALGLVYASLGLVGLEALRASAFARLSAELEGQILPDGGHRSRNPAQLLDLLVDLEPIRIALEEARLEVPAELNAALERMLPMLRFFAHGDGGLASFNGVRDTLAGKLRSVLEADVVQGRPLVHAVHSGYCRLVHGGTVVIADVGRPPPPGVNPHAGAGALSFEFSDGPSRIVVNCGTPPHAGSDWQCAACLTGAHSTVCLGDASAGLLLDNRMVRKVFGTPAILGFRTVEAAAEVGRDGSIIEARHDGYAARYGIAIERRLYLAGDGKDLRGEDRFLVNPLRARGDAFVPFAVRFHLHPSIRVTLSKDAASVMLLLPDRTGWRFAARGGQLRLEDSVYLTGQAVPRRTQQIVIRGTAGRPDRVIWAFKRIEKRRLSGLPLEPPPTLPL